MLAAWPGMGNVALGSIDYLRRQLGGTPFAELDVAALFTPDRIGVTKGLAELPAPPKNLFYYCKEPEPEGLIVFESEAQLPGAEGIAVVAKILDLAQKLGVNRIYTGAAFPAPIHHREPPEVFGVGNTPHLRSLLRRYGLKLMEGGEISGLNGLVLGYARQRGIEAVCILATIPVYAVNFPNPKAYRAIVEVMERLLSISPGRIDMVELDRAIFEMDQRLSAIEARMREAFEGELQPEAEGGEKAEEVPQAVLEQIERLFEQARVDRKVAYRLKEELDRWGLFKSYEDRFLDLFKREITQ